MRPLFLAFAIFILSQNIWALKPNEPLPHDLFINLAKKLNPTVVNISTLKTVTSFRGFHSSPFMDPLFDFFFQQPQLSPQKPSLKKVPHGLGTGFIISKDGLIITNNHVIKKADTIQVSMVNDKTIYKAKVIGRDARTDIALIKINSKRPLQVASLGKSKNLQVGEWVAAIGNPFGYSHTITKGIVSGIGRQIDELNRFPFIQTDTPINPGNSGGPLVNTKGEVIGVNTAIKAWAQGIGFAIPIDNVKSILKSLQTHGRLKKGFIGVVMYAYALPPSFRHSLNLKTFQGVLIQEVVDHSPAKKAGLKSYDFITKINNKKVKNPQGLIYIVSDLPVGKTVAVEFIRNGVLKKTKVTIQDSVDSKNSKRFSHPFSRKNQNFKNWAPYKYGFKTKNYSTALAKKYNLPFLNKKHPVVVAIANNSVAQWAGLKKGDLIVKLNKKEIFSTRQLYRKIKKASNLFEVLRYNQKILIYLENK